VEITDKRRANISKILINIGSIVFAALVVSNFSGVFDARRLIGGIVVSLLCFGGAVWIEK
jgi:hypothetical protein